MKRQIRNFKNKGFVLFIVLILFLVLFIIGTGAALITYMGYFSISAEAKYQVAEKRAEKGLLTVVESGNCTDYSEEGIIVKALKDDRFNNCFLWSEGTYQGAKVIKVSVFPLKAYNWSAAMFRKLNNLSGLGGNAALIGYDSPENSCDDPNSCISPALTTGNNINPGNVVVACYTNPNNLGSGIVSTVDPYVYDPSLQESDLTSKIFNAGDRNQMLLLLSSSFQVQFDNGSPTGLVKPEITLNVNSCNASGTTITCGSGSSTDVFIWNSEKKAYQYNKDNKYYSRIDFGPNAQITFDDFSGGGYLAGNNISFSQKADIIPSSPLIVVARNQANMTQDQINISDTFMFAKNYDISGNNLTVAGGLIYSGGGGVGNLNINLNSNSHLGISDKPILIISDNNIDVQRNGNADIWGIIYVTSSNNDFNIGKGEGNFKIHGTIISNSLNNNNINLSGNFEIRFNYEVLKRLYTYFNQFNIFNPPVCGISKKNLFIITTIRVY